jgi:hypothetical protein
MRITDDSSVSDFRHKDDKIPETIDQKNVKTEKATEEVFDILKKNKQKQDKCLIDYDD